MKPIQSKVLLSLLLLATCKTNAMLFPSQDEMDRAEAYAKSQAKNNDNSSQLAAPIVAADMKSAANSTDNSLTPPASPTPRLGAASSSSEIRRAITPPATPTAALAVPIAAAGMKSATNSTENFRTPPLSPTPQSGNTTTPPAEPTTAASASSAGPNMPDQTDGGNNLLPSPVVDTQKPDTTTPLAAPSTAASASSAQASGDLFVLPDLDLVRLEALGNSLKKTDTPNQGDTTLPAASAALATEPSAATDNLRDAFGDNTEDDGPLPQAAAPTDGEDDDVIPPLVPLDDNANDDESSSGTPDGGNDEATNNDGSNNNASTALPDTETAPQPAASTTTNATTDNHPLVQGKPTGEDGAQDDEWFDPEFNDDVYTEYRVVEDEALLQYAQTIKAGIEAKMKIMSTAEQKLFEDTIACDFNDTAEIISWTKALRNHGTKRVTAPTIDKIIKRLHNLAQIYAQKNSATQFHQPVLISEEYLDTFGAQSFDREINIYSPEDDESTESTTASGNGDSDGSTSDDEEDNDDDDTSSLSSEDTNTGHGSQRPPNPTNPPTTPPVKTSSFTGQILKIVKNKLVITGGVIAAAAWYWHHYYAESDTPVDGDTAKPAVSAKTTKLKQENLKPVGA